MSYVVTQIEFSFLSSWVAVNFWQISPWVAVYFHEIIEWKLQRAILVLQRKM